MSPPAAPDARFLTGSPLRHVTVNSIYGALGFLAIFSVDLADIFFLSLMTDISSVAGVGFAGTLLFLPISVCIGMQISTTANVSKAVGAGDWVCARRLAINALVFALVIGVVTAVIMLIITPGALDLLGAKDRVYSQAFKYQIIMTASTPILAVGMSLGGILRANGDPRRAMYGAAFTAVINALLDPLFIYLYGVEGAAYASVVARVAMMASHGYWVIFHHKSLSRFNANQCTGDLAPIAKIAFSAIIASLGPPLTLLYMTYRIAPFGEEVISGWAIIGRIIPVAFCGLFALSSGIGPVLGQNFGGKRFDRVLRSIKSGVFVGIAYTLIVWAILAIGKDTILFAFSASGGTMMVITFFCFWYSLSFLSESVAYVSTATYNNTGYAPIATLFGYLRIFAGVVPAVELARIEYGTLESLLMARCLGPVAVDLLTLAVAVFLVQRKIPRAAASTAI
ncbi:MAG: MATE family efflux transporter [Pseudomonadota bacterium]